MIKSAENYSEEDVKPETDIYVRYVCVLEKRIIDATMPFLNINSRRSL